MHFKEIMLIWQKWFHKKLARRYKEVVSVLFHYTLKSSKQKNTLKRIWTQRFFTLKPVCNIFIVMFLYSNISSYRF